jgi:transposase
VVIGGVDTHKELHVAGVVDTGGVVLATHSFSTTRAGCRALICWVRCFGDVRRVGVEGTGSYGAGVTRHLRDAGIEVLEVDRPDRTDRRRKGKDDDLDAINAAARCMDTAPQHRSRKTARSRRCRAAGDPADRDPRPPQRPAVAADEHRLRAIRSGR